VIPRRTLASVLDALVDEGLATSDAADRARATLAPLAAGDTPWYVRVLAGIGAWLATAFVVAALASFRILRDPAASTATGALLVAAVVLPRHRAAGEFARQLVITASLAGQALLVTGVGRLADSASAGGAAALVLSIVLLRAVRDPLHRFLSTVIAAAGALVLLADGGVPHAGDIVAIVLGALLLLLWRRLVHDERPAVAELAEPMAYGATVALALLLTASAGSILGDPVRDADVVRWLAGPLASAGLAALLLLLLLRIATEWGVSTGPALLLPTAAAVAAVGTLTRSMPGVVGALVLLVLGHDRRRPLVAALATALLLGFLAAWYWSLHATLAMKGATLVATGALLLGLRWWLGLRDAEDGR
jgi:hypothetical protein